ncbi:hypothetical protein P8610_05090 [Fictibacillus sp. UD]|uniref:hypothetical protein n=1 Tax=Fictibacillus sp. UD TaxID=3038777 RepID=UPI003745DAE7
MKGLLFLLRNTRVKLNAQHILFIIKSGFTYGTTNLKGYGQVIVHIKEAVLDFNTNTGNVTLKIFTPTEDILTTVPIQDLEDWTPYYGPIPPHFGHQGGLPGGMGGQGYGQGQTFPSQWGGQGTPGGWGTWGY